MGRAEIERANADLAAATAMDDAIADAVQAFAEYRAQSWLGSDGRPLRVPVINPEDLSPEAALMGPMRYELCEPLMRPATNADWIDPLVDLASLAAMAAGPAFRLAGTAAKAIDAVGAPAIAAERLRASLSAAVELLIEPPATKPVYGIYTSTCPSATAGLSLPWMVGQRASSPTTPPR